MTNYEKYRESYIKAKKKYNSKPEVKEKRKEYMKKYRKEHKEEIRIARQKYRDKDINKFNERNRMYQRKRRENYKENAELVIKQKEVLDKIRKNNARIIDYGFDYDGFNKEEDLKKLIDMLVDYAKQNDKLLEEIE